MLDAFLHWREVITRRTIFELRKGANAAMCWKAWCAIANVDEMISRSRFAHAADRQGTPDGAAVAGAGVAREMPERASSDIAAFARGASTHGRAQRRRLSPVGRAGAQEISMMRLQRLTGLEQDKTQEYREVIGR